jgi:DNA helicase-2/ATP-dependent DNA helicase PcrA
MTQNKSIPAAIAAAYPDRTWSAYQADIFAAIADPASGNRIIRAVAGSGKSTTIVAGLLAAPAADTPVFLAFNKSIAEELKAKGVNARTFHSICYTPVTRAFQQRTVDTKKLQTLLKAPSWPQHVRMNYGNAIQRLVGLARNDGIGCLVPDAESFWYSLAERHDISPDTESGSDAEMIAYARRLLAECNASPLLDFDDLLYRAVRDNIPLPRFSLVLVDEAQDTNAIQRAILRKVMTPKARLIAVGDEAQAIYGFRGADSDSMQRIADEFNASPMPLSITYRCASAVVKYARQWAAIEAAPDAAEGTVNSLGSEWRERDFGANDLVVCRTNAPLLALAYRLIRSRVPCHVMGKDIGKGLTSLIERLQGKGIDGLLVKLGDWQDRETAKANARDNDALAASIADKADSIRVLIEGLTENERTVPALCRLIDEMFSGTDGVRLASIHKAKGLEAGVVWWLNRAACPSKWAKQAWQQQSEINLCYVAATRAKHTLNLIEMGD